MKKQLFAIIITLISNFSYGQLSQIVAKNEKAIFQIFSFDEFGTPYSTGTGFFINSRGIGLSNFHVLDNAKFAFIRTHDSEIYQIEKIVRISKESDMVEFQVSSNNKTFNTLNISNIIPPKASDIFVIGNPEGFENTVSTGIISSLREEDGKKIIQISAPISPGSSGSPIMDMTGNVIGIATYQYKQGQNLNFGYWIGCMELLKPNNELILSNNGTGNLFVVNKTCKGENDLILNSIEINEKNTVLNFSYTNSNLAFGDGAFIFTTISDKNQSFFIEDINSGKKYYVYDATIGNSAKSPTYLKLGETRKFKLFFPPIDKSTKIINVKEGMSGSDWSFSNLNLSEYKELKFEDNSYFNDFYFQTGLSLLSEKNYAEAYVILKDYASQNSNNDYAHNLAGIISFVLGNNLDAFLHIKEAIKINPTSDTYYFNLYFLNNYNNNTDEAIRNISSAIQLNDDMPEYYHYRSSLYIKKELWKEALSDLNVVISSDRQIYSYHYFYRGICKLYLEDRSACKDLEKAYSISTEDENKKEIQEWYNKYCR